MPPPGATARLLRFRPVFPHVSPHFRLPGGAVARCGTGATARTLLVLTLVVVVLATAGWTTVQTRGAPPSPRSAALAAWREATVAGRPLPSPDAPPATVAAFFDRLTPARQQRLAERFPLVVGNLNGAPLTLRYQANRLALQQARERERARASDTRLTEAGRHRAHRRMQRFASLSAEGRQILAFDPTGPGRAAEVFGDLGRAERVSVVVPGVDTELLTFERTARAHSAPVGMARALYREQRAAAPGRRVAVVAWADYTAPDGLTIDALTGERAEEGGARLASLLRSLPRRAPVALFCHSYGSVVCAFAADDAGGTVTDVVAAGSPGMRADRAADLGPGTRVWAMRAEGDWIGDIPHLRLGALGHGRDPMSPDFGARRLASDGVAGHREYFRPGTTGLANMAAVGIGAYERLRCAGSDPHCALVDT